MTFHVAVLVAVIAAVMIVWYRIDTRAKRNLAEFKAETERHHDHLLLRAQEKVSQAELALSIDKNDANQQAYNEAVFELNALKATG